MNPTAQQNLATKMILDQASPLLTCLTNVDAIYQAAASQGESLASRRANAPPTDPTGTLAAAYNTASDLTSTQQKLANLYLQLLQQTGASGSINGKGTTSPSVKAGMGFSERLVANQARGQETLAPSPLGPRMQGEGTYPRREHKR